MLEIRRWHPKPLARAADTKHAAMRAFSGEVVPFAAGDEFALRAGAIGWHMIEISLVPPQRNAFARLSFYDHSATGKLENYTLPLKAGGVSKRLVHISLTFDRLRCEIDSPALDAKLDRLSLVWMLPWAAYDRAIRRLIALHPLFRDKPPLQVLLALVRGKICKRISFRQVLLEHYDETFIKHCGISGYANWLEIRQRGAPSGKHVEQSRVQRPPLRLKFCFVVDANSAKEDTLFSLVERFRSQTYRDWELYVLGAELSGGRTLELEKADGRIKFMGADVATGAIRACVAGEFLTVISTEEHLSNNALESVRNAVGNASDAALLYTDEDFFADDGRRCRPLLKPDWSPDLLFASNYIGNAVFWRRELLDQLKLGLVDLLTESKWDISLSVVERNPYAQVMHVPEVLWHRAQGSLASGPRSAEASVAEHGRPVDLKCRRFSEPGLLPESHRMRWPVPSPAPLVSLLIPTRDQLGVLKRSVGSILDKTRYQHYELIVLDNQSACKQTLDYLERLQAQDRITVQRWNFPFNYSAINNFGVSLARGEIVGLLNNDVEVINPDWLDEMVSHAIRPEIGCVGAKLYYPDGTIQHGGVILGIGGVAGHAHRHFPGDHDGYCGRLKLVHNLSAVTAACLLVRKSVYEKVKGLDEVNLPVAYNDVDFCLRVREAGYRNLWTPHAELYHHESLSRGADDTAQKRARAERERRYMRERWGAMLDEDPYYNPNLTLIYEDFSLR